MQEIETLQYEVRDDRTFLSAIQGMVANSKGQFTFVAPCELPSLNLHVPFQNQSIAFAYRIVIGDTAEDFALFWNLCAEVDAWKRPYQHFLWLDPGLLQNPEIVKALVSWVHLQADSYGSNRKVELLSRGLSVSQLH